MDQVELYFMKGVKAVTLDQFGRSIRGLIDGLINQSIAQWLTLLIISKLVGEGDRGVSNSLMVILGKQCANLFNKEIHT